MFSRVRGRGLSEKCPFRYLNQVSHIRIFSGCLSVARLSGTDPLGDAWLASQILAHFPQATVQGEGGLGEGFVEKTVKYWNIPWNSRTPLRCAVIEDVHEL